ncbi:flagellar motor switch protein FliN [Rhizobium sp. CRIBSB]|uniref:Flagellar motor switch protein FliN n=1 Tax=Peteryoungia aggregata LMG 23059 TaxID=1368425 RepID=A0ABU0G549_9HYPH|nr:flagellar motor switch protein FliN [Peteryoungia aggregata]MDQ0419815.1 flagellar motor switch protein FliN/FliY [Peteryoungia aggregata LMG 23059]NBB48598.1 flagellar motor switch protein FliN [Rhizobium sp. CRIBSB]
MATKKTPPKDDDALAMPGASDSDFDQAVDDLRGVLKADADGGLGDFGPDLGLKDDPLAAFESDFGGGAAASPSDDFGLGDFGGSSDLGGGSDFGGSSDFGGTSDFGGGSDFGGSTGSQQEPGSGLSANLDLIMDIPIEVQIVLGSSKMQVSGLMSLEEGAIIALDKKIGEPVEIMVNGRRIARGEITVLENDDTRFGVKLIEVMATKTS